MELNIDAGTSYQNHKNAGLFTLYARLRGLEITPDVVKSEKTVAPAQVERALMELADNFKTVSYKENEIIIRDGPVSDKLFIIIQGKVSLIINKVEVQVLESPSSFGDIICFQLENSKLKGSVSHKKWIRPDIHKDKEDILEFPTNFLNKSASAKV